MRQLSPKQRELVSSLAEQLGSISGVKAVVLGGSYARGRAQPGSDIDLGLLYSEAAPFSTQSVRELGEAVNDTAGLVVTDFYEWGPWVNGGAWLTVGGQRVDFIYRSVEHLERVGHRRGGGWTIPARLRPAAALRVLQRYLPRRGRGVYPPVRPGGAARRIKAAGRAVPGGPALGRGA